MANNDKEIEKIFKRIYVWELIIWIAIWFIVPIMIYYLNIVNYVQIFLSMASGISLFMHGIYYLKYKKMKLSK